MCFNPTPEEMAAAAEICRKMTPDKQPAAPLRFVYDALICDGSQVLMDWLRGNAPEAVQQLFDVVAWANCYYTEALKHDGMVSESMNDEAAETVLLGLRLINGGLTNVDA